MIIRVDRQRSGLDQYPELVWQDSQDIIDLASFNQMRAFSMLCSMMLGSTFVCAITQITRPFGRNAGKSA